MGNDPDPLAHFGLDAIDLRWTLKDIAAKRAPMINKQHLAKLIELGLVEMREDARTSLLPDRTQPGGTNDLEPAR